jgi:hypothetical protein
MAVDFNLGSVKLGRGCGLGHEQRTVLFVCGGVAW